MQYPSKPFEKNFKIRKGCPFCPQKKSRYVYKTWIGLIRHVYRDHLRSRGKSITWSFLLPYEKTGDLSVRIWTKRYSQFFDIPVKSKEECDKIVFLYATENPSYQGISGQIRNYLRTKKKTT